MWQPSTPPPEQTLGTFQICNVLRPKHCQNEWHRRKRRESWLWRCYLTWGFGWCHCFCCASLGINESREKLHSNCYCTTGHWWDFLGKKIWLNKYMATSNLTQSFFRSLPHAVFTKVEDGYLFPPHTKVLEDLFNVGSLIQCSFDVPHMPFRFFSPWARSFELGLLPMYGRRWSNYSCSYIATLIFLINIRKSWHQCACLQDKRSFLYQYPAYSIFLTRLAWVVECDLDCIYFIHGPYSGAKRIVRTRHRTLWFAEQFWKCGMMDQLLYLSVHPLATGRKIFEPVVWTDAKILRCRLSPHTSRGVWPARIKQEWACLPGLVERQPEQTNQSLVGSKGVWFRGPDWDALECPNDVCLFSAAHVGSNQKNGMKHMFPKIPSLEFNNFIQLRKTHQDPFLQYSFAQSHFPSLPPKPPNLPQQNHVKRYMLTDASGHQADLVLGCDGIRSAVRQALRTAGADVEQQRFAAPWW